MAKTIESLQRPTLVLEPNKTLAAQVAAELREFSPITQLFILFRTTTIQPETYVPSTDTFIEKDAH